MWQITRPPRWRPTASMTTCRREAQRQSKRPTFDNNQCPFGVFFRMYNNSCNFLFPTLLTLQQMMLPYKGTDMGGEPNGQRRWCSWWKQQQPSSWSLTCDPRWLARSRRNCPGPGRGLRMGGWQQVLGLFHHANYPISREANFGPSEGPGGDCSKMDGCF